MHPKPFTERILKQMQVLTVQFEAGGESENGACWAVPIRFQRIVAERISKVWWINKRQKSLKRNCCFALRRRTRRPLLSFTI